MEQFSDLSFIPLSFVAKDSSRRKRRSVKNPAQPSRDQVSLVDRLPLFIRLEIDQFIYIIANIPTIGIFQSEQYCMKVTMVHLFAKYCMRLVVAFSRWNINFYGFICLKPPQYANASDFCLKATLENSSLCATVLREKSHKRVSRCADSDRKEMHQDESWSSIDVVLLLKPITCYRSNNHYLRRSWSWLCTRIPLFVASFRIPQKIMGTTNPAWWILEVMNLKRECYGSKDKLHPLPPRLCSQRLPHDGWAVQQGL